MMVIITEVVVMMMMRLLLERKLFMASMKSVKSAASTYSLKTLRYQLHNLGSSFSYKLHLVELMTNDAFDDWRGVPHIT
jgi:hypothetical protein